MNIQYCPITASNLDGSGGVALFYPELQFLQAKFGRRRTRVHQLFGKHDWDIRKHSQ
jgi:hypothetical protein